MAKDVCRSLCIYGWRPITSSRTARIQRQASSRKAESRLIPALVFPSALASSNQAESGASATRPGRLWSKWLRILNG